MSPGTVLIVDDDPTVVKLVKLSLEGVGFQVLAAIDGAKALDLLSQESLEIGVAVIDYQLPGTRLQDLLQQIRSQTAQIRSIVTSGYSLEMLEEHGGLLPAGVDFLKKPFMPGELVALVRRAFIKTAASGS